MSNRLRKPFRANIDDDEDEDDGTIVALDEQEQEDLIEQLKAENERKNAFFTLCFAALCLIPASIHIIRLITGNGNSVDILAISSLAMTGFTVYCVPVHVDDYDDQSPLEKWVPILNPVLIIVITLAAYLEGRASDFQDGLYLYLPLVTWLSVLFARKSMGGVDMADLEKLKYKYKGA